MFITLGIYFEKLNLDGHIEKYIVKNDNLITLNTRYIYSFECLINEMHERNIIFEEETIYRVSVATELAAFNPALPGRRFYAYLSDKERDEFNIF